MKRNTIAVCDSETGYAGNLAEYMNTRKKLPLQAEAFTDPEKFCQYAKKKPPAFLLISEENLSSKIQSLQIPHLLLLTSDKELLCEGQKCIYKYQSAESLIHEVMEYCQETVGSEAQLPRKRRFQIIGVYSPLNRCGKTLFTLTAGQIWGESRNVLYLNMEDYSGWKGFTETEPPKNLSEFFYCLRQNKKLPAIEDLICSWGNLDYISPLSSFEDLRNISFEEWLSFFSYLEKESGYQLLLLDIGHGVEQLFPILEQCAQIYMPILDDWISRQKLNQFKEMADAFSESLEGKIQELHLPLFPCSEKGQDFPKNLLWGKWGAYIKKLLEVTVSHE